MDRFKRTELLLGPCAMNTLKSKRVAVFGVGGVGGYAVEALVRSGIEKISLIDNDTIAKSNINRQIIATEKTLGMDKVTAFKERIKDINKNAEVEEYKIFYTSDTEFDFSRYDYIIDAIDTVKSKVSLAVKAQTFNVPIISAMGAGNKLNPMEFIVSDIYKTSVCPLARVMRSELKKQGVKKLKVVYSKETPVKIEKTDTDEIIKAGSIAFVPSVMGLIIAGEVIKDLIK